MLFFEESKHHHASFSGTSELPDLRVLVLLKVEIETVRNLLILVPLNDVYDLLYIV